MKPCYIKLSAFGSYAGCETIEFEKEKIDHGIFLITGDTGAGKTTLFDGITYALYDRTSGDRRDGYMMRSQFASPETVTYVEYEFVYKKERYRILRSPKQLRLSRRKNKDGQYTYTEEQGKVELYMPDGKVFPGKKADTDKKIIEILGLTFDQFTQVSMIAQGEFLKLLLASSKDRKQIFERIFKTGIYAMIEQELAKQKKELGQEISGVQQEIAKLIDRIKEIAELNGAESAKELEMALEFKSIKETINSIIEQAEMEQKKQEIYLNEIEKKKSFLDLKLHTAKEHNEKIQKLGTEIKHRENLLSIGEEIIEKQSRLNLAQCAEKIMIFRENRNRLEKALSQISERKEILIERLQLCTETKKMAEEQSSEAEKEAQIKIPLIQTEIIEIEKTMPEYQKIADLEEEIRKEKAEYKRSEEQWESICAELVKIKEKRDIDEKDIEEFKKKEQEQQGITHEILAQEKNLEYLKNLDITITNCKEAEKNLEVSKAQLKDCEEQQAVVIEKIEQIQNQWFRDQALYFRQQLEKDSPCPVCGSIHHPAVEEESLVHTDPGINSSIQENLELEKLQEEATKLKEIRQRKEKEYTISFGKLQGIKENIKQLMQILQLSETELSNISKQIQAEKTDLVLKKKKQEEFEIRSKKIKDREEELLRNKAYQEELILKKEDYNEKKNSSKLNLSIKEELLNRSKEQLKFSSYNEAVSKYQDLKKQVSEMEEERKRRIDTYQTELENEKEVQGQWKAATENYEIIKEDFREAKEIWLIKRTDAGFDSEEAFENARLFEEEQEVLIQKVNHYKNELMEAETTIRVLREALNGKEEMADVEELEKEVSLCEQERKDEDQKLRQSALYLQEEKALYSQIKELYHKQDKKIEEFQTINRLSDTANGKISGKRINFQTYVQRKYFNQILIEANKRLFKMSNGQFLLQCRELDDSTGNAEAGLDLDVYSVLNQKTRDVKTLSGGESFMAALAMALGMGDVIQNSAGSISMETVFIDEGFGSLSEESRNQAIQILRELTDGKRLVGIISHVTELKSQIDTKLIVRKTKSGSRTLWEKGSW